MEQLPYLAKVNLCWLVFAACHWLLFRKHTFFKLNRAYLLATLTISMIVPALGYGYRMLPPLPGKFVDLKIKLPKQ